MNKVGLTASIIIFPYTANMDDFEKSANVLFKHRVGIGFKLERLELITTHSAQLTIDVGTH